METLLYSVYKDKYGSIIYINAVGKLHRIDGPAYEGLNGTKEWWVDGKLHRTDGPARIWADGSKFWYQNGKLHRTDGPAVEKADGTKEFWIDGNLLTEEEFLKYTTIKEFSMDELADKLGIPVELLKIKK